MDSIQHKTIALTLAAFSALTLFPGAMTASGELQVPAPVDYVTWTEQVAGFASRDDLGTSPRVLLHTGKLSPAAAGGFQAAGWKLVPVGY